MLILKKISINKYYTVLIPGSWFLAQKKQNNGKSN